MLRNGFFLLINFFFFSLSIHAQTAIHIENGKVYQNGKVLFYCSSESTSGSSVHRIKNMSGAEEMVVSLQSTDDPNGMQFLHTEFPLLGIFYEVKVQPTSITAILQDMVNQKVFEYGKLVKEQLFPYLTTKKYIPRKLQPKS